MGERSDGPGGRRCSAVGGSRVAPADAIQRGIPLHRRTGGTGASDYVWPAAPNDPNAAPLLNPFDGI